MSTCTEEKQQIRSGEVYFTKRWFTALRHEKLDGQVLVVALQHPIPLVSERHFLGNLGSFCESTTEFHTVDKKSCGVPGKISHTCGGSGITSE